MPDNIYLRDVLFFLGIAVVVTPLCHRLRMSPILGYLLVGALVGPHGLALVSDSNGTHLLAEMGVVFLLFMIGLELSIERLRTIRHYIFGLGSAQVVLSAVLLGAGLYALERSGEQALVLGLCLAFSSTAFVLQLLHERGQVTSQTGRLAVAVLILQDIAVVPLLVLIPLLGGDERTMLTALALAAIKAVVALLVIFAVARIALRPLFRVVAATRSPEVFVAAALLTVLATALVTEAAGLSLALGAFLAGVLLAGTEYRHQVEAEIQPIRGLLLGLFFLTVGMMVELPVVANHLALVAAGLVFLLVVKATAIIVLALAFRFPLAVALNLGLLLAQGGEFAFVVLGRAADNGVVGRDMVDVAVVVITLSMAVTPLLASLGDRVMRRFELADGEANAPPGETRDLTDHVIIAGFGRVGQTIAALLKRQDIPYVALDRNPRTVTQARKRGDLVFYGDAGRGDVLLTVGADRARAAVLTLDNPAAAEKILLRLRREFPKLRVLVRARDQRQGQRLESCGANAVVPETLEGSLQLAGALLRSLGGNPEEVNAILDDYRQHDYALLAELSGEDESLRPR